MIKTKCQCCDSEELENLKNSSFFKFPVLKCLDCESSVTQIDENFDLKKYYDEIYWSTFRNIENKDVNKQDVDSGYLLKKFPKFIQNLVEITGVRKAQAFSQFNYVLPFIKGKKILEIGSGEGFILEYFSKNNFNVFGIEPSTENVERINKRLGRKICIQGFAEDVEKMNEKFDAIILSHVFEHVVNCRELLSTIYEKLSKTGILFLEVPNCSNKIILEHSIFEQPHIHHFTLDGFEKIAEKTNFKIIKKDIFYSALETLSAHIKFLIYWFIKKDFNISSSKEKGTEIRVIFSKIS